MIDYKVAPSILSGDFANMGDCVRKVNEWGADYVHVDVMDGSYVPNITFGMPMLKAIKPYSNIPLDVHLMIVNPEKYIDRFIDAGADILSFHPEASQDTTAALQMIKARGIKAGLVINPNVEAEVLEPYMGVIDMIILMGVYPGFGGQKYIESVTEKIVKVSDMIDKSGREIELELDGGVTIENCDMLKKAGVKVLVGGNAVFSSDNPSTTIARLKRQL